MNSTRLEAVHWATKVSEQQRAAPRGGANGLESHQTVQTVTLEQVMRLGGPGITVKAIAHTFI